jgi:hypothetical protein
VVDDKDRLDDDDVVAWEEVLVVRVNVLLLVTDGDGDEEKSEDETETETEDDDNDNDEEDDELPGLARAALMMSKRVKKENRKGKGMEGKKRN